MTMMMTTNYIIYDVTDNNLHLDLRNQNLKSYHHE